MRDKNGPFPSYLVSPLFQNESSFDLNENELAGGTHFHMNGFVRRLVLKPRQKAARKRPVAILYWMPRSHVRILIYQTLPFQKEVVLTNTFCAVLSSPVTSSYIGLGNSLTPSSLLVYDKARQHITLQNQFICLWYLVYTVDCIYLWTLPLKTCFHLTSNVYVLGVKLWSFPAQT